MQPPLHRTTPGIHHLPDHLQGNADAFIRSVTQDPVGMQDAIDLIRVDEGTGGIVHRGIQRDASANLASHIGTVVELIESGTDRYFRFDPSTDYRFSIDDEMHELWAKKRDIPASIGEIAIARQIRLRRLQLFAGRMADPFGLRDYEQLRSVA